MNNIRILMIEDNKDQQKLYLDAIENFNDTNTDTSITIEFSTESNTAIKMLSNNIYDSVLIDLQLEGDKATSHHSGNDVLDFILNNNIRMITYIVSGTLNTLKNEYMPIFKNPLLRTFSRDDDSSAIIEGLVRAWKTGVTKILGKTGILDQKINDIFIHHLSNGFTTWEETDRACEKELLRYTALHLLEYLDLPKENEKECAYYAPEFYIYPPIKKYLTTGDIVIVNDEHYVLISPSCDITPREIVDNTPSFNVETVVLIKVLPLNKQYFDNLNIRYSSKGKTDTNSWDTFANNIREGKKARFHYLPTYLNIVESAIDFKRPFHLLLNDYLNQETTNRIATVSSPFIHDIQSRYSSYYARQGQPMGTWSN